jgi:acyl carrier protein
MEEEIASIISQISEKDNVQLDDNLIYILGFDSKKVMQLIIKLENHFDISIKEDDLDIDNFTSLNSIVALVKKYQTA